MIAVLEIGGNQYIVKAGDIIEVDSQDAEVGSTIKAQPLLISDESGKDAKVGTPFVEGASVELKVVEHFRGDKIRVFKMKSKKRYARTRGFRAERTKLEVVKVA